MRDLVVVLLGGVVSMFCRLGVMLGRTLQFLHPALVCRAGRCGTNMAGTLAGGAARWWGLGHGHGRCRDEAGEQCDKAETHVMFLWKPFSPL